MIRHLKNVRNLSLNWVLRSLTVLCYAFATSFLHYLCSKRRQEKITLRLWNVRSKSSQLDKNNFKDASHTDSVILTVDLRLDYNHCLEAIEDNFEPHTTKNRIFEVMFNLDILVILVKSWWSCFFLSLFVLLISWRFWDLPSDAFAPYSVHRHWLDVQNKID